MKHITSRNASIYRYVLTLDTVIWPRKIADEMSSTGLHPHLISVTDLQNTTHLYGAVYRVRDRDRRAASKTAGRRMDAREELAFIQKYSDQVLGLIAQDGRDDEEQQAQTTRRDAVEAVVMNMVADIAERLSLQML